MNCFEMYHCWILGPGMTTSVDLTIQNYCSMCIKTADTV